MHTPGTLTLRLQAMGYRTPTAVPMRGADLETTHSYFRVPHAELDDLRRIQPALENGSWGLSYHTIPCPLCQGTKTVLADEEVHITCWECHGTGQVTIFREVAT